MCVSSIVNSQNSPARSWLSPTYPTYLIKGSSKAVGKSQIVVVNKYESVMYGTKFHSSCESFSFFHTFGPGGTVSFCTVSLSSSVVKSHFFEILLPLVVVSNHAHAPRLASYDGVVPCWGDDGDLSLYTARPCDMKTCVHVPTTRVVPKFSCFPPCPWIRLIAGP